MDPVTHTLTGALIGQAGLKRRTGLAMPALIVGANLPDIDVACFLWLDGVEHLAFRRGITHGPIAWVLLPLLLAGALWWFDRWQARRGKRPEGRLPVHFGWLYGLSFLACLTHPALDWLNVYGIRLLEPFSSRWFYGDVLFIIDVWLWLGLGFATWFSMRREKRGGDWRRPAQTAIAAALAYVGLNGAITAKAESDALAVFPGADGISAIASPVPLDFWNREIIWHGPDAPPETARPLFGDWNFARGLASNIPESTSPVIFVETADEPAPFAADLIERDSQLAAFLFWSRTPFVECGSNREVLIRDARYYDPRARNRFTVSLPDVRCEPL